MNKKDIILDIAEFYRSLGIIESLIQIEEIAVQKLQNKPQIETKFEVKSQKPQLPQSTRDKPIPMGIPIINPMMMKQSMDNAIMQLAEQKKIVSNVIKTPSQVVEEVKKSIANLKTLDELKEAVMKFDGCDLKKIATNTVFSDGNPKSQIMIIGEAPGNNEDLQGIPFCGDSGQLLDDIFSYVGLTRKENLYISNVLFWRPPGNRRPTDEELDICRPFTEKHIALIKPQLIVAVGATSMFSLLKTNNSISKMRGKFMKYKNEYMDSETNIVTIFHPSYLMRQPQKKKIAWIDAMRIKKFIDQI